MPGVSSVNVFARDTLEVVFDEPARNNSDISAISAWTVEPLLAGMGGAVDVLAVTVDEDAPTVERVILTVSPFSLGYRYVVIANGITTGAVLTADGTVLDLDRAAFTGRVTKTDNTIRRLAQTKFDLRTSAKFRRILDAITREDDRIGGTLDELPLAFDPVVIPTVSDFEGWFIARSDVNQSSNLAVGNHYEMNQSDGSGVATLATGAGQANGLITVNESGDYYIEFAVRMQVNEGLATLELQDDNTGLAVNDKAGQVMRVIGHDDQSTDSTEGTTIASIVTLTAGDVLKLEIVSEVNLVRLDFSYSTFAMLKVS